MDARADTSDIVDRLAALPALDTVPRDQLAWLVDHGEIRQFDDGQTLFGGDGFTGLVVVIAGLFSVRVKQHGVEREIRDIPAGHISGFLPYSKMTTPRGHLAAVGHVEFLVIRQDDFPQMTRECYEFTGLCVQEMLGRARAFKADDQRQEKMAALGRLSAGLAHELNNPASAVLRDAGDLEACRASVAAASLALGASGLDERARPAIEALQLAAAGARQAPLSPLDRATLEDSVCEWLDARGIDSALGFSLTESGIGVEDLESACSALDPAEVPVVIRYVSANAAAQRRAAGILTAAARIQSLVAAVKKHTHMDQAPVADAIALGEHLADAVTLLGSKASQKGATLELTVEATLPRVAGSVADLNQVWMHLIDNAIDAVSESGQIRIDALREQDTVVVRVLDNGSGIAIENQERVFEPFFTTKEVGEGRGLGLDVVHTVVRAHRGTVTLTSQPGRTEFRVALPAAPAAP